MTREALIRRIKETAYLEGDFETAEKHFARALELGADSPSLRLGYAAALESLPPTEAPPGSPI